MNTTTFPATVVGLRWSLSFSTNVTTADVRCYWAIVVIHDGLSAQTISTSDGSDFYTPEQDVLAFGVIDTTDYDNPAGPVAQNIEGSTKAMRKLKAGDKLSFITLNSIANGTLVRGAIQFFLKS